MKKTKKTNNSEWPASGDVFYWVRSDTGDVCESHWCENSMSCRFRLSIGNVFQSRKDAEHAIRSQIQRSLDRMEALK